MDPNPETVDDVAAELDARDDAYLARRRKLFTDEEMVEIHAAKAELHCRCGRHFDASEGACPACGTWPSIAWEAVATAYEADEPVFALPDVGDLVAHGGVVFRVARVHQTKQRYPDPTQPDRTQLSYNIVAWEGQQPYEEPSSSVMF